MADDAVLKISVEADASGVKAIGEAAAEIEPKLQSTTGWFQKLEQSVEQWTKSLFDSKGAVASSVTEFEKLEKNVEKSQHSMMEARHATMMIAEDFQVHLPRAVASFIASIGPIGALLEEAFPILAVLALVEVVQKAIEKHEQYANELRKSAAETVNLTIKDHDRSEQLEVTNLKLEDQIMKFEGRPTSNKLAEALLESKIKADEFASSLESDFVKMDTQIDKSIGWVENLKQAFTTARGAAEFLANAITPSKSTTLTIPGSEALAAAGKDQNDALEAVRKAREGVSEARMKMSEVPKDDKEGQLKAIEEVKNAYLSLKVEAHNALDVVKVDSPKNEALLGSLRNAVVHANEGMIDMNELAKNLGLTLKTAGEDVAAIKADKAVKEAHAALEQRLADIDVEKAAVHSAFEAGTTDRGTWLAAEKTAVAEAMIANEQYHATLVTIYTASGQLEKVDVEAKALAALQTKDLAKATETWAAAEDKHREIAAKMNAEMDKLNLEQVTKDWKEMTKAVDELAVSEKVLVTAQGDLNKAAGGEVFATQIEQIKAAASERIITKRQEADQLTAVYEKEKAEAIIAIDAEIAAQKKIVDAAKEGIAEKAATYGAGSGEEVAAQATYNKDLAAFDQLLAKKLNMEKNFDSQIAAAQQAAQAEQLASENAFISQSESAFNDFAVTIATTQGVVNGRISEWKFVEQQFSQMVFKMEKDFLAAVIKMVEDSALFKGVENTFREVFDKITGLGSLGGGIKLPPLSTAAQPAGALEASVGSTLPGAAGAAAPAQITSFTAALAPATSGLTAFAASLHAATAAQTTEIAPTQAVTAAKIAEVPATTAVTTAQAANAPAVASSTIAQASNVTAVSASTAAHTIHAPSVLASTVAHIAHAPAVIADTIALVAHKIIGLFGGQEGGHIQGPGTGTSDSIRMNVSAGEYIVKEKVVSQPGMLDLLHGINQEKIPAQVLKGVADKAASPSAGISSQLSSAGLSSKIPSMAGGGIAVTHLVPHVSSSIMAEPTKGMAEGGTVGGPTSNVNNSSSINLNYHAGDVSALDGDGVEAAMDKGRGHVMRMFNDAVRRGAINPRSLAR